MNFTVEQVERFREDGFLVVEDYLSPDELESLREAFTRVSNGEFLGAVEPEIGFASRNAPDTAVQELYQVWKSDPAFAAVAFKEEGGRQAAQLMGSDSTRLLMDSTLYKPAGGSSFSIHQDAAFFGAVDPVQAVTRWITLDDVDEDTGTLIYLRGSHKWGKFQASDLPSLTAHEDWMAQFRHWAPDDVDVEIVPVNVKAGTASFHSGWVWHGSPAMRVPGRQRRAYTNVLIPASAKHNAKIRNPHLDRVIPLGSTVFPEEFFPILWSNDGHRSEWLDDYVDQLTELAPINSYQAFSQEQAAGALRLSPLAY